MGANQLAGHARVGGLWIPALMSCQGMPALLGTVPLLVRPLAPPAPPAPSKEEVLLTEIRDLLKEKK